MALFSGDLRLRPAEAANLAKVASAAERMAVALEALIAKLNQPDPEPPPDDAGLQAQIDELTRRLMEANDQLEAKTAQGNSA